MIHVGYLEPVVCCLGRENLPYPEFTLLAENKPLTVGHHWAALQSGDSQEDRFGGP